MISKYGFGPAFLVSAAFIGPGTIITCIVAGSNYGYSLLWAILFGIVAVIILQEMVVRASLFYQDNLSGIILRQTNQIYIKIILGLLIIIAIGIGNSAYEGGNILGASLGIKSILKIDSQGIWVNVLVTLSVFLLLYFGRYLLVERVLTFLVFLMGFIFIFLIFYLPINFSKVFAGFIPHLFQMNISLTIISLIGTTIVPYNLFLHSTSAIKKWKSVNFLSKARLDLILAVLIGGLISVSILISSASFGNQGELRSISDLSASLKPALGEFAVIFLSIGVFAAGITSAITAPLAVAFTVTGLFNQEIKFNSPIFRASWILVLFSGFTISLIKLNPILIIQAAQVTNAILLPLICGILLVTMNNAKLGIYRNGVFSNLAGLFVFIIVLILGGKTLYIFFQ